MSSTNFASFVDPATGLPRVANYDIGNGTIRFLSFASGTPVSNLYQVIEGGYENLVPVGDSIAATSTKILPPLTGRDILAVGKNYSEHAKEFNSSGFDSSDKVDIPTHPVVFTKRSTSIIADGEDIYPHLGFTETVDYEGEIGVIIGKAGFQITEENAMSHVWGYTIINDVTARERQRDHKQFFIGKSADTFCPMGPIAVPADSLPSILRVQTFVNGEPRQDATTEDLIFSIPFLIKTLSEGQTLQPGDVLATGTPAGVGIGKKPPVYLKEGDEIVVAVTGLGKLTNKMALTSSKNYTVDRVQSNSMIQLTNAAKTINGIGLTEIGSKNLYYRNQGPSGSTPIFFVHGLGGTLEYWTPLISKLLLTESHSLHLFDLEGHGLSPSSPLSSLSIASFAEDLGGILHHAKIRAGATLIAHSMGCLAAIHFVISNPGIVDRLVLIGPPPSPLPEAASAGSHARAETVRTNGISAVVDDIIAESISTHTREKNPVATTAARLSLLGQDPEGFAKACTALALATNPLDLAKISARTLIITGSKDAISSPILCEEYAKIIPNAVAPVILQEVGHWHIYEDVDGVASAVGDFL